MAAFVASLALLQGDALACSCAAASPKDIYERSRASFIGVLESVEQTGYDSGHYHYRVKRSFKRDLGDHVVVQASLQGSACRLPKKSGRRIALGLYGKPGRWKSGSCYRTSVRGLREAAAQDERRAPRSESDSEDCGATKRFGTAHIEQIVLSVLRRFA